MMKIYVVKYVDRGIDGRAYDIKVEGYYTNKTKAERIVNEFNATENVYYTNARLEEIEVNDEQ